MKYHSSLGLLCFSSLVFCLASVQHPAQAADKDNPAAESKDVLDIGSRRELFVDHYLIDKLELTSLKVHHPHDAGVAMKFDKPWEGAFCGYATVIKDGPLYRMYYRGRPDAGSDGTIGEVTCYAESKDGISWTKPSLGLFEVKGTKENNIILVTSPFTHNFCPMLDPRKDIPKDQRFKALAGTRTSGLAAYISADGIHWRKLQEKPVITEGAFDSQNVPFWSEAEQQYLCYFRTFAGGFRRISRTTSKDFVNWSEPVLMEYDAEPVEHLYTNQTSPYFRAPHIYVAIAARFFPGRRVLTDEQAKAINVHPKYFNDCSDGVLLTTRGGNLYNRTFMEGFLRPGIGLQNWVSRTNYPVLNVIQTGENEMSVYANLNYGQSTAYVRRFSMRIDGFISVNAPYRGGEMITKPIQFSGKELSLNFTSSAAGGIRVEIQDATGKPIPGFTLKDSVETIGNELDRAVHWKKGSDVSSLAGQTVRLRFVMKDADLYSLRFQP